MNRLSHKERGFVKDIVKGENGTNAVLNNYDTESENTASSIASENLRKPKIVEAIKSYADRIPDELLERVHLEGLEAGKIIIKDEQKVLEPDYPTRHKYLDTAYKLKGSYAPEKSLNLDLNVDITNPEALKLAQEYEEAIKKGL